VKAIDRKSGDRFERLELIKEIGRRKDSDGRLRRWFLFRCECGTTVEKRGTEVFYGNLVSCGCYRKEVIGRGFISDRKEAAVRKLYRSYQHGAKRRKLEWSLSQEEFEKLIFSPCHYTGRKPNTVIKVTAASFLYNGIDRVDNQKGYSLRNCVPCCSEVNAAKSDLTTEEFLTLVKEVYQHSVSK
jgi:hypothetical protein